MPAYVCAFVDGGRDLLDTLGGKGANLCEMTRLGLPVPPGFVVTTQACRYWLGHGAPPPELDAQIEDHLRRLEQAAGRRLGQVEDPLLVSVRSGARFSMPGMMETVLDLGLNDGTVEGLAAVSGDPRFAWDSYRRLVQMYGRTVLGVDPALFEGALTAAKQARGSRDDLALDVQDLRRLVADFQEIVLAATGRPFPQDPREQVRAAVLAVFRSWNTDRARLYRRQERIPDDLGTAVTVMQMVFGNLGENSGTGVAFTRDPATGQPGHYGDYLPRAQGEDVVAGIRNTLGLADLARIDPPAHAKLQEVLTLLERHYQDLCDVEFTVERGRLWILQTRVGKRTAAAAFRIAAQLVDEGLIDEDTALTRVAGRQLGQLMFPHFDPRAPRTLLVTGTAAGPGAAVGRAAFSSEQAIAWAAAGDAVVLVRRETNPDDLGGMVAAKGVLTSRGGKTSHAAVVARGMGRPCVVGAEALEVDHEAGIAFVENGPRITEGDVISIDGATGEVFVGAVPVVASPVARLLTGDADVDSAPPDSAHPDSVHPHDDRPDAATRDLLGAVRRLMDHADARRRLEVRANADTAADAARARALGAQGIGLCRTEHMFLGERRALIERVILAEDVAAREVALAALLPLQRADFTALLAAMDGLPVVIRLLDPPLHEFLPDRTELAVRVARAEERGTPDHAEQALLHRVEQLTEHNPMLGTRGVRLGLLVPELFRLQVRAVAEATVELLAAGRRPRPEIMVPLVADVAELTAVRIDTEAVLAEVFGAAGVELDVPIGTMIELPRAALTAGTIAGQAAFFSFGTNDLTQTTWGFSRDDVEGAFFAQYLARRIFTVSPFESLDTLGVGRLVELATAEGRAARPDLEVGVCGEHGGDPESIHFFAAAGLDYVSCSPFRVPVARLEAGRAAVLAGQKVTSDTR